MVQDQEKEDSVYDFLYVDLRRLAQLSSQFNQYGNLTSLTRSATDTRAGGGSVGVAQTKVDKSTTEQIGQTKHFDPQWLNPLTFLDEANRRKLINRKIEEAGIGKFVIVQGQLLIFDVEMMRDAWSKPSVRKVIKSGFPGGQEDPSLNRAARRSNKNDRNAELDQFEGFMELLQIMPHALQARLINEDENVWCTLEEQYVSGKSSDLVLKHGALVVGDWNIVGILDAYPYDSSYKNDEGQEEADIVANIAGSIVGQVAARIGVIARNVIGRPNSAYGITPLIIFREVSG